MASAPSSLSSATFRAELANAVAEAEERSAVELVVLVAPRSGTYPESSWLLGVVALVAVFATLVFHEATFGDYTLFLAPLVAFALAYATPLALPRLRPMLAGRAAVARNVELVARATFQKAGLGVTRDATALLVYLSEQEGGGYLVADRGVVSSVPQAWLDQTLARYLAALRARDAGAILSLTRGLGDELARYLPRRPDDMNELPDAIDVAF